MNLNKLFFVVALVAFLVDAVFVLTGHIDPKVSQVVFYGGLSAFAAGHIV